MRDILGKLDTEIHLSDPDPVKRAQKQMLKPLPKRFYKEAKAGPTEGGFAVLLDGRPVKTPSGKQLLFPTLEAATLSAFEYEAQTGEINPSKMPVTRLANTAVDGVADQVNEVLADIRLYASSDLVCYRSEGPEALAELQALAWDPYIGWAKTVLGARFFLTQGVMPVEQPASSLDAIGEVLEKYAEPFKAACLHSMTTLTGSALVALAVANRQVTAEEGWRDAHVDEDWTISQWGADEAASLRRTNRWQEMEAAARLLQAVS
jgi:chaperone required for assembly of F1-ATPase